MSAYDLTISQRKVGLVSRLKNDGFLITLLFTRQTKALLAVLEVVPNCPCCDWQDAWNTIQQRVGQPPAFVAGPPAASGSRRCSRSPRPPITTARVSGSARQVRVCVHHTSVTDPVWFGTGSGKKQKKTVPDPFGSNVPANLFNLCR